MTNCSSGDLAMSEIDSEEATRGPAIQAKSELQDLPIKCIDCAEQFLWTIGEQAFFHDKGLENPPKRCKECKKAKTRRLDLIEKAKLTGKKHVIEVRTQCARCMQQTTVPFYPSQGKPVFCRACFLEQKAESAAGGIG
jgi:CxxC-x17-CxxC domain-containing protein